MQKDSMALIRFKEVASVLGIAKSTLYLWIAKGRFPKPTPFGARMVAWRREEIQVWIEDRGNCDLVAGKSIVTAIAADRDKLLTIIASAYQIAGAHDAPAHVLDVLANPECATDAQVDAMLPYQPGRSMLDDIAGLIYRHTGISARQFPDEYAELDRLVNAVLLAGHSSTVERGASDAT